MSVNKVLKLCPGTLKSLEQKNKEYLAKETEKREPVR